MIFQAQGDMQVYYIGTLEAQLNREEQSLVDELFDPASKIMIYDDYEKDVALFKDRGIIHDQSVAKALMRYRPEITTKTFSMLQIKMHLEQMGIPFEGKPFIEKAD